MRLETVTIKGFRSIDNVEVAECGDFNVLIGKNNSGKSNILAAIDAFFSSIRNGNVVTLNPPIRQEIDFFNRNTEAPIQITLAFSLLLSERDALTRDIVSEAPQMSNAVDGIDPSLWLSVTLNITPPPNNFGYVSKIALGGTTKPGTKHPDPERIMLRVNDEAALGLRDRFAGSRKLESEAQNMRRALDIVDPVSWRRFSRARGDAEELPIEMMVPPTLARSGVMTDIETVLTEVDSYEEFTREVGSLISAREDQAASVRNEPLGTTSIGTFAGEESSIPSYVQNLLRRISELKVLHLADRREQIGAREAQQLLRLKVRRGRTEVFNSIQETVGALLGVRVDVFESEDDRPTSRRTETPAEMDVDEFLVEVNGSGIKEALRLVLDVEFQAPRILLVEEPEIHLHPALEIGMMQYLKQVSSGCQVFITTHSTNFLDTAEMRNVYLVSKPDSTRVQLLDAEGAEEQIPRELGIRLSALFMFDRLMFVEGPSDEAILREWASKLGVNFSQSNVGFITMGGARNLRHFAADATLSFLKKRQVRMWFLIDRDEKDEPEVRKIRESVGDNAVVKVLEKRELENYLISPRAIADFIGVKRELSGVGSGEEPPDEHEIAKTIDECADTLKNYAIYKRLSKSLSKPVYPSGSRTLEDIEKGSITTEVADEIQNMINQLQEAKASMEEEYDKQAEEISKNWPSNKLNLVPGDMLLDMVCAEYGVRFIKERDGVRLASLMNANEISEEIEGIIRESAEG
jgi:putative ATP-dependent endonuclease of OLD family